MFLRRIPQEPPLNPTEMYDEGETYFLKIIFIYITII